MSITPEIIKKHVSDIMPDVLADYRHLHAHPELSFSEHDTAEYIKQRLNTIGIPFKDNIGGYGILGAIKCKSPESKCIALRADMDALPIHEKTNLPFSSLNEGIMHACGHDTHMASLIGVASVLWTLRNQIHGTILLIFQPGEEKAPGGASLMLKDRIFDGHKPQFIIGQHSSADHPTGTVAFATGTVMSSADEIHMTISGHGGHGAMPHTLNDTVLCASQIVVSLQQIVSRLAYPFSPTVVTIGKFIADGSTNVIPDNVCLTGTIRTMDETWRKKAIQAVRDIASHTAEGYGCTATMKDMDGYPAVINDNDLTLRLAGFAKEYVGSGHVLPMPKKMTSEDFGFFSQQYPSCFYRFGTRGLCNKTSGAQHTATFSVDPKSFYTSVGVMTYIAISELNNH